jgi:hypothetical protein
MQIREDDEVSRKLFDGLVPLDHKAATLIATLERQLGDGNLSVQSCPEVGELAVADYILRAYGQILGDRGEAAGYDFQRRAADYDRRLRKIVEQLTQDRRFRSDTVQQQFQQLQSAGLRQVPDWQRRVGEGALEPVEQELLRLLAELERYAIWLEDPDYSPEFSQILVAIRGPLETLRQKQLSSELVAVLAREDPKHDEFLARIDGAIAEVKRGGVGPWKGTTLSGPKLAEAIILDWQAVHQRALRCRALHLASRGSSTASAAAEEIERVDVEFAAKVRSALAELIEIDGQRAKPAEVASLYLDYVQALSGQPQAGDRAALISALQPALDQLAAKDQVLAAEVRAYAGATSELLRWRRRVADAQGSLLQKTEYPHLTQTYTSAVRNRLNDPALLSQDGPSSMSALHGPAPAVLRRLGAEVVGRPCTVMDVVGLGGGKAMARCSSRTYVRLTLPLAPDYDQEVAALKRSLLVTADQPPLTLDAALTLGGALHDRFERVGGVIEEIGLEPLLTRLAMLPDQTTGISPPDRMPSEPLQEDLRSHVLARFHLAPRWVQHECFIVVFPVPVPRLESD